MPFDNGRAIGAATGLFPGEHVHHEHGLTIIGAHDSGHWFAPKVKGPTAASVASCDRTARSSTEVSARAVIGAVVFVT
eukprot:3801578-Amphidinium_carterae.1